MPFPESKKRFQDRLPARCWINQPSTLQPYHRDHGLNVIAVTEQDGTITVYPISGDCVSFTVDRIALSVGWIKHDKLSRTKRRLE